MEEIRDKKAVGQTENKWQKSFPISHLNINGLNFLIKR